MDNSKDRKLDRHEFQWGLKENGHVLSPSEFERIFKFFDKNNDGKIDYNEFLRAIRGHLNDRRRSLVQLAFQKFDKTGNGVVDLQDLVSTYDVTSHPKFRGGALTRDEILNDFLSQWDTLEKDGKVSLAEFEDYYKDVSASIDDDDYFELMIRNAWQIQGGQGWSQATNIKTK
jgi:Ca2+-binding EF-hand superfamily protein